MEKKTETKQPKKKTTKMEKLYNRIEKAAYRIVEDDLLITDDYFKKAIHRIESTGNYKLKEYDDALKHYSEVEPQIWSGEIATLTVEHIEVIRTLIRETKNKRKEKNKRTSKMDTNLLAGYPFTSSSNRNKNKGGLDALKKIGEAGIAFARRGIRHIYYQNANGDILNSKDFDVLSALYSMWEDQGNQDKMVFSLYQLQKKLKIEAGGKQVKLLKDSYDKLSNTKVILHYIKETEEGREHTMDRYPLIIGDSIKWLEDNEGNVIRKPIEIAFHPDAYESFKKGEYSLISLDLVLEISSSSGKALYSLISALPNMPEFKLYWKNGRLVFPLEAIYEHLMLTNKAPVKNKKVVDLAAQELKALDIISNYEYELGARNTAVAISIELSDMIKDIAGYDALLKKIKNENTIVVEATDIVEPKQLEIDSD